MLDDEDKKNLGMTFCSKLMLMPFPPGFSFCSCYFLKVDFQFVADQAKARAEVCTNKMWGHKVSPGISTRILVTLSSVPR